MKAYKHQEQISKQAYEILRNQGLVYLSMEERTGKTLTAILTCEMTKAQNILIITKKKALKGWDETLEAFKHTKSYDAINYESLHKIPFKEYDLIILDEAHANLSAYPKLGKIALQVRSVTYKLPVIYLSATPSAQTYAQLFHQFAMTQYSPFRKYSNFYNWFTYYGIPDSIWLGGRQVKKYDKVHKDLIWDDVEHLFISYTRKELGFEHEPNDMLHWIDLDEGTRNKYRELEKEDFIEELEYAADSPMKKLVGLHQLEGGTLKLSDDESIFLGNTEKIGYIKEQWGDSKDLVIFYHYKEEEKLLHKHFSKAQVLQATSFAEGVDLSMYKTLLIYSMDFSTARYSQRRARQCNMKRAEPIDVHYLLVKDSISHQVYTTVAINKKNFVNSYYEGGQV
jgi:hypothetical protein